MSTEQLLERALEPEKAKQFRQLARKYDMTVPDYLHEVLDCHVCWETDLETMRQIRAGCGVVAVPFRELR